MLKAPLLEYGKVVEMPYKDGLVTAYADPDSGYVFFDPPADAELARFYMTEYGRDDPKYYSIPSNYNAEKVRGSIHFTRHVLSGAGAPLGEGQRIHELGCAFGGLVEGLNAEGFRATGSDLNKKAIAAGSTLKNNRALRAGAHVDVLREIDPCDVILASHTLEHDPRLADTLRAIAKALKPTGVLFASVPNCMYAAAVMGGFRNHPWAAYPDHLHMLSPGCIGRLCDEAGLDPLMVWTHDIGALFADSPHRAALERMHCLNGQGLELMFVLTPAGRPDIEHRVKRARAEIEVLRRKEVALRQWLAEAEEQVV